MQTLRRAGTISALASLVVVWLASGTSAREIRASRISSPPVIDGSLDEACWHQADVAGEFTDAETRSVPTQPTFARLCYDSERLYVAYNQALERLDGESEATDPVLVVKMSYLLGI